MPGAARCPRWWRRARVRSRGFVMAAVEGAPVEREVGGGLEKFKMLQDVAVNESQKDARLQGCTQWSLCKEEMLEEKTDPASLDSEARNKMKNWKSKMEIHEK